MLEARPPLVGSASIAIHIYLFHYHHQPLPQMPSTRPTTPPSISAVAIHFPPWREKSNCVCLQCTYLLSKLPPELLLNCFQTIQCVWFATDPLLLLPPISALSLPSETTDATTLRVPWHLKKDWKESVFSFTITVTDRLSVMLSES